MSETSPKNARIIIVDDDELVRDVISSLLRRALPEAQLVLAAHGEEGLALYREARPAVVITDLRMLGMSGAELIQSIRIEDETTPIYAITGAPDAVRVPGATAVLQKAEFRRLIALVTEIIRPGGQQPGA